MFDTLRCMKMTIYTDGSSRGNPGPGGWAAIILTDDEVVELGGREDLTTNNRMELMGTIEGLRHVSSSSFFVRKEDEKGDESERTTNNEQRITSLEVCTDSEYVKKGMTEWIAGWIKKGWKTSTKKDVLNRDLWEKLLHEDTRLRQSGVAVMWKYVRGHAGIPGNERADTIATGCADNASQLQLYRGGRRDYPYIQ